MVQLRTTNISYKNKKQIKRLDEEKVIVYNTHEPIISQELWDKVKEIERSVSQGKAQGNQIVHPLSGLMYCEDCGNKMHIGWNNTRHNNHQKEKEVLENEISQITERIEKVKQNTKNVDEFIERVKKYINSPVLTREMALELIEFITIDKFTKGSKESRKIYIYYKLIDNINGIDFKCNKQKRDRL